MMTIIKDIFNLIRVHFAFRKAVKFERTNVMCQKQHGRVTKDDVRELKGEPGLKTEVAVSKEETNLFEGKEGLALKLLLSNLGDQDSMNETCDFIKENHLVEDYK